jgi:hypothetical protein
MFTADSHYAIGKSHLYCQDYALQGQRPVPFLIVSDGCSSSPHSDTGARLVAQAAREYLQERLAQRDGVPDYREMGLYVARKAQAAARVVGIPESALDATLLTAFALGDSLRVHAYGDGQVVTRDLDGRWRSVRVGFSHNAPYYLSYLTQRPRHADYARVSVAHHKRIEDSNGEYSGVFNCQEPSVFCFDAAWLALLAIASDGLDSFVDHGSRSPVPTDRVIPEMLTLKNPADGFVKRRMGRALRTYAKRGIWPSDDLALGVLLRRDEGGGDTT